jgi:hypothetical protein
MEKEQTLIGMDIILRATAEMKNDFLGSAYGIQRQGDYRDTLALPYLNQEQKRSSKPVRVKPSSSKRERILARRAKDKINRKRGR